jgi:DNA-binding NtrC family response regulator
VQNQGTILIVEDDIDWQEELSSTLKSAGYECEIAGDYSTGLEKLRQNSPLTLVLDLQLRSDHLKDESFKGWELAQHALENNVPIVIVTGHPSVASARKAYRQYKVIDFFDKMSLDSEELIRRVSEGVEAAKESSLSINEKRKAVKKLREMFYQGITIKPNNLDKDN